MPVVAVGLITDFEQAEAIVGTGDADLVALARGILYDPRWPWHAAAHLGGKVKAPTAVPAIAAAPAPRPVRMGQTDRLRFSAGRRGGIPTCNSAARSCRYPIEV